MPTRTRTVCGATLRRLRLEAGLNLSQLGVKMYDHGASVGFVGPKAISRYEEGKSIPGADRLAVMAEIFDDLCKETVTVDSLYRRTDAKNAPAGG